MESRDIETMIFEARMEAVWHGETIVGAMLVAQKILAAASEELKKLKNERDEARREISKLMGGSAEQHWYASRRGWDCFAEETK